MAIKDSLDLAAPIVDVQPAYNLLHVANANADSIYPKEARAFARFKILETIESMREHAKYLEDALKAK